MELSLSDGEMMAQSTCTTLSTLVESRKPIAELKGTALENDTVQKSEKGHKCKFCDHMYFASPSRIRDHLLNTGSGNHIKSCTPNLVWKKNATLGWCRAS